MVDSDKGSSLKHVIIWQPPPPWLATWLMDAPSDFFQVSTYPVGPSLLVYHPPYFPGSLLFGIWSKAAQ